MTKVTKEEEMGESVTLTEAYDLVQRLRAAIRTQIFGMDEVITALFIGLFSSGANCHILLDGPPGTGKTTLVKTLCAAAGMKTRRIQFAPDLFPQDIVGAFHPQKNADGEEVLQFLHGPLFTNLLLADELNRARSTVKASILEPMEEGKVSTLFMAGEYELPKPFMVMATQNPVEAEGTFPLGRAELDRFLLKVLVPYLSHEEEVQMARKHSHGPLILSEVPVEMSAEQVLAIRDAILHGIHIEDRIYELAASIAEETRPEKTSMGELIKKNLEAMGGASPRVPLNLIYAARVRAFLEHRFSVDPSDLAALALPILRHRLAFIPGQDGSEANIERIVRAVCAKVLRDPYVPYVHPA